MRQHLKLTIASLIAVLLTTFHLTDDALHMKGGLPLSGIVITVLIAFVMLLATLELTGRRSGYVILFFGGLLSAYMAPLHGMGPNATRWGFFFIWTMYAMAVVGLYIAVLAGQGLWRSFRPERSNAV